LSGSEVSIIDPDNTDGGNEVALATQVGAGSRMNSGSMSLIDLDARMSVEFVPNRWISEPRETDRARNILQAAYRSQAGAH
jgi:hypothetical protein